MLINVDIQIKSDFAEYDAYIWFSYAQWRLGGKDIG